MPTITMISREARLHLRELLDHILRGDCVIITRYGQPAAAVVPYALWQQLRPAAAPPEPPEPSA